MRRCLMAMHDPEPRNVQLAVKNAILSLISINAAITLMVAGPLYGAIVFALVVPAMTLGIWIYST